MAGKQRQIKQSNGRGGKVGIRVPGRGRCQEVIVGASGICCL